MNYFYKCTAKTPYGNFTIGKTYHFLMDIHYITGVLKTVDDNGVIYSFNTNAMQTFFEDTSYNSHYAIHPSSPLLGGPPNSTIKDPDIKAPQMQTEIVAEYVAERTPYDDYMERFCLDEY